MLLSCKYVVVPQSVFRAKLVKPNVLPRMSFEHRLTHSLFRESDQALHNERSRYTAGGKISIGKWEINRRIILLSTKTDKRALTVVSLNSGLLVNCMSCYYYVIPQDAEKQENLKLQRKLCRIYWASAGWPDKCVLPTKWQLIELDQQGIQNNHQSLLAKQKLGVEFCI